MADEHDTEERTGPQRPPRLRNLARRIFREIDPDSAREEGDFDDEDGVLPSGDSVDPAEPRSSRASARSGTRGDRERHRGDPWALLGAVLETGDKAKSEMVRMLAREVRTYLEALELHKDLHHLLTNYSLEVNASFHLKPLADAVTPPSSEPEGSPAEPRTESRTDEIDPQPGES